MTEDPTARERQHFATLAFYGAVLLLGYLLVRVFQPFFHPLAWAAVLAICVQPWHEPLLARYGRSRAAGITTAMVSVLIVVPGVIVMTAFVREAKAAFDTLDRDVIAGQYAWLSAHWERLRVYIPGAGGADLATLINQASANIAGFLASRVGGLLADLAVLVFHVFVTLFALFFLLRDAGGIMRLMRGAMPFEERRRERIIHQTRDLVYASVTAGLIIASLQGLVGGLLFAFLDLDAPVFWGVVMGFFALLPFLGTWVVWLPAAIFLVSTGQTIKGLTLAAAGAAIVASIDNVLRPALLAGRAQMNGLLMFVSLLGGVSVFGLIGLVLGPLVVALAAGLLETYAGEPEIVPPPDVRVDLPNSTG
jgi:predicted PurR-regulated permease PerM